jgi:Protein of unknown function (DUF4242)
MGIYLVERYLPDIGTDGLRALAERLETASAELRGTGVPVRYLGSLFLPDEESCFCRLEAPSAAAARSLNELAAAPYARISAAVALDLAGG